MQKFPLSMKMCVIFLTVVITAVISWEIGAEIHWKNWGFDREANFRWSIQSYRYQRDLQDWIRINAIMPHEKPEKPTYRKIEQQLHLEGSPYRIFR